MKLVKRHTKLKGMMTKPMLKLGMSAKREMKNAFIRAVKALPATACLSTGAWAATICSGAIDTATKSRPTSAPPALALAMKKLANSGGTTR